MISLSRRGSAISSASEIVAEGMLIAGWVAMWRPLEIFYDWWPIRRRTRVLGKLSAMPVVVRAQ